MKCPIDQTPLAISERHGVEIDYCSECRGVWLDRGELDKIIEKAEKPYTAEPQREHRDESSYRPHDASYGNQPHHRKKKRESFLGDLFDF